MRRTIVALGIGALAASALVRAQDRPKGVSLASLTWAEAEPLLTPSTVVVLPLGAGSKEHGLHLKLDNDARLVRYLASRVERAAAVVLSPTLMYHYDPSFAEYPGSTTLTLPVARDMTADVIRSLARYGPRRFYVLNTSISAARALDPAASLLADEGIAVRYTNFELATAAAARGLVQQPGGSHADEIETSMMLYIDPASVEMTKAARDYNPSPAGGRLTRTPGGRGTYSPTGAYGDPSLATTAKGRTITEALLTGILDDIEQLRSAPLPPGRQPAARPAAPATTGGGIPPAAQPNGCTAGDEREIRELGAKFQTAWRQMDPDAISLLFTPRGDIRHPDGNIERGRAIIRMNRADLFKQRAYRDSVHPVSLTDVRCLGPDTAIADGKWELRNLTDEKGNTSSYNGLLTLVVRRLEGWSIEAWRYTITPPDTTIGPTILKKPGWPGIGKDQ